MAKHKYLTAAEEASYGRFEAQAPEQAVLERFFFLDDADLDLVAKRRGDRNRLGFSPAGDRPTPGHVPGGPPRRADHGGGLCGRTSRGGGSVGCYLKSRKIWLRHLYFPLSGEF